MRCCPTAPVPLPPRPRPRLMHTACHINHIVFPLLFHVSYRNRSCNVPLPHPSMVNCLVIFPSHTYCRPRGILLLRLPSNLSLLSIIIIFLPNLASHECLFMSASHTYAPINRLMCMSHTAVPVKHFIYVPLPRLNRHKPPCYAAFPSCTIQKLSPASTPQ